MEKKSNKLSMAWVERIFERLECIYKDRWRELIKSERNLELLKIIWSTGLSGLDAMEVKRALSMCESFPESYIPTVIEFYHFAKGIRVQPRRPRNDIPYTGDKDLAKKHIDEIRSRLTPRQRSM